MGKRISTEELKKMVCLEHLFLLGTKEYLWTCQKHKGHHGPHGDSYRQEGFLVNVSWEED